MTHRRPLALVVAALAFAADRHRDHRRKDSAQPPYVNHLIAVVEVLVEHGVDDPLVLAAAALHDTVEDTATSLDELRAIFGDEVAAVVAAVTDDKSLPKAERKRRQIEKAPSLVPFTNRTWRFDGVSPVMRQSIAADVAAGVFQKK